MSIEVLDWVIICGYITVSAPLILLVIRHKSLPRELRWYTAILACHLTSGVSSEILWRNGINPNYAASLYYTFVIILYARFFVIVIKSLTLGKYLPIVIVLHVLLGIINVLFIQKETLNTFSGISFALIVISLCLLYYYSLLKNLPSENLLALPLFWIITAEFMVNTGQMIFKSFAHFLINIFHDNLIVLWVFHHGLAGVGNLFILYGVWQHVNKFRTTYSAKG